MHETPVLNSAAIRAAAVVSTGALAPHIELFFDAHGALNLLQQGPIDNAADAIVAAFLGVPGAIAVPAI
jgi:hypothetical protein